jgi:hypothetical protein
MVQILVLGFNTSTFLYASTVLYILMKWQYGDSCLSILQNWHSFQNFAGDVILSGYLLTKIFAICILMGQQDVHTPFPRLHPGSHYRVGAAGLAFRLKCSSWFLVL